MSSVEHLVSILVYALRQQGNSLLFWAPIVFNELMKKIISLGVALFLTISLVNPVRSNAIEMQGMISYNLGKIDPTPTHYTGSSNAIGYTFLGKFDLGPGQVETGFQFVPTSITTQETIGEVKHTGSFWILPLLYRFNFLPPFFSLAAGLDYAVVGTSNIVAKGVTTSSDEYRSHFGAQASFQVTQDLGENLSAVLDFRYRNSLANAATINNDGSKYQLWVIGLGIQKHLE